MIWEDGLIIDHAKYDLSRLEFVCENSGVMTDYAVTDMGCSLVSERLKTFFESNGIDNVQYFPATVIERVGEKPKGGYYAANFIGLLDCIDREASEMNAEEDENGELNIIFSIDKLVLKDTEDDRFLSRACSFSRLILIDDSFIEKFNGSQITGLRLIEPEWWDGINGDTRDY